MSIPDFFADIPETVKGLYSTGELGSEVVLFQGELKLQRNEDEIRGDGTISLGWNPSPKIRFNLTAEQDAKPKNAFENGWAIELSGKWAGLRTPVEIISCPMLSIGEEFEITGSIRCCELGTEIPVRQATMQIANLTEFHGWPIKDKDGTSSWKGRAEFGFENWTLTIDSVQEENLFQRLSESRGFAITHNCEVQRAEGSTFTLEELLKLGERLHVALSFCCGRWAGPVLFAGYDQDMEVVSEAWLSQRLSRFSPERNWFSHPSGQTLISVVEGVFKRIQDETWRKAIERSVYWYVNACTSVSLENSLVIFQIIFELLGWMYLVEETGALSAEGYKSLSAADKLRLLLVQFKIPTTIPEELDGLSALAKSTSADGPKMVTEVRNSYVHPGTKNREFLETMTAKSEYQSWYLSAHYVELIFLALFGYEGKYVSRVATDSYAINRLRLVPWVTPTESTDVKAITTISPQVDTSDKL